MMRKALLIFLAVGYIASGSALAAEHRLSPMKADNFLHICNDPQKHALCDAYLAGVADGGALTYLSSVHETGEGEAAFCIPSSETTGRMRSNVVRWLQGHRSTYAAPLGKAVVAALHDSYPCKEARSGAAP